MVMDACRLGFEAERFDAVTAQFVITLVPDPEQALAEMDRVLKPGGEIVISSRLVDDGGLLAPFWAALAPLAKAVGWSSDFKVSRLTGWAARTGRYETVHVGARLFQGGAAAQDSPPPPDAGTRNLIAARGLTAPPPPSYIAPSTTGLGLRRPWGGVAQLVRAAES